jgi:hypothetical protein
LKLYNEHRKSKKHGRKCLDSLGSSHGSLRRPSHDRFFTLVDANGALGLCRGLFRGRSSRFGFLLLHLQSPQAILLLMQPAFPEQSANW